MKSILVIGMGKFGRHLCQKMLEFNVDIMIVDIMEEKLRDFFTEVAGSRVGDCTSPDVLEALGLSNFDLIIVTIKNNFQNSLEVTNLVKELGGKYVISLAERDIQAKFLERNGADEVIYPDRDVAYNLAARCSTNNVFDYIELDDCYSIYEIPVLDSWLGRSIREVDVQNKYHINIIGIVSNGSKMVLPRADYVFLEGDHIQVISSKESSEKLFKKLEKNKN